MLDFTFVRNVHLFLRAWNDADRIAMKPKMQEFMLKYSTLESGKPGRHKR